MTEITPQPVLMTDMVLELGDNDFAAACNVVRLEPESQIVRFKGLKRGAVSSFPTDPVWNLRITFADDWDNADSLSDYLWDHSGETVAGHVRPQSGIGTGFDLQVMITPGGAGGTGDQVAISQLTLGVDGQPTRVDAAAAAPTLTSLTPAAGAEAGGNIVQIRGRGFTGTLSVKFDTDTTSFIVASDRLIYAVVPAGTGTDDVTVTNGTGTSAALVYTYES